VKWQRCTKINRNLLKFAQTHAFLIICSQYVGASKIQIRGYQAAGSHGRKHVQVRARDRCAFSRPLGPGPHTSCRLLKFTNLLNDMQFLFRHARSPLPGYPSSRSYCAVHIDVAMQTRRRLAKSGSRPCLVHNLGCLSWEKNIAEAL
jgi:hypothetical protein